MSPSLLLISTLLVPLLLSSPHLLLSSPLSTIAVSFVSNQTVVCALVITTDETDDGDDHDRYTLNCTSISNRRTKNYPAGAAYYAGIAAGDGFLCGLSNQAPSVGHSIMRWWELSDASPNAHVKRLYRGPPLVKLDAGDSHVCGLSGGDQRMHCWRWKGFTPPNVKDLVDVAVGRNFVCAVLSSGKITCYSDSDDYGVLANRPDRNYTTVAAGATHACALSTEGSLECWGTGAPMICDEESKIGYTSLALGHNRTCAIRQEDNKVFCWGDGFSLPKKLAVVEFSSITANKGVFCGVAKENFSLYCWGSDESDSNNSMMVFDQVLPGPCVSSCSTTVMSGSGRLCQTGTNICEGKAQTVVPRSPPPPPPPPPSPVSTEEGRGRGRRKRWLIYMVVGSVGFGVTLAMSFGLLFFGYCKKKCQCHRVHDSGPLEEVPLPPAEMPPLPTPVKMRAQPTLDRQLSELISKGHSSTIEQFSFQTLIDVTDGFSEEKKIGSGSYGSVYRAVLNGREVAIKRAEIPPTCGNRTSEKANAFLAELTFLSRVNHLNLVQLLGFSQDEMELVLVYDYMANGTLHDHLHKLPTSPISSWKARIALALDAARGIEYLHRYAVPAIIHRDIKSSNILLDDSWTAKVSDFGLSLIGPEDDTSHISLRAAGTVGYMDPEYYRTQCLTTKSDVYSFGVVLLELLTGCKAIHRQSADEGGSFNCDPRNVVDFAVPHINNDEVQNVLDPNLPPPRPSEIEAVQQLGYLAAECVRLEGRERPDMTDVVYGLEVALDVCAGQPLIRSATTNSV